MLGNEKKFYANKLIQTRIIDDDYERSVGSIFSLVVGDHKSEPYYYVGSTNNIGFFIHADIVNERALFEWKRKLESENDPKTNLLQFKRQYHDGKL